MELGLMDKNVIVTGGGNNIGRAIVLAFAAEGCNIAIAELNREAGEGVAGEVEAMDTGATATVIDVDVTDRVKTDAMIAEAVARLGSVDVLVNNVGWTVDRLLGCCGVAVQSGDHLIGAQHVPPAHRVGHVGGGVGIE